MSSKAGRPSGAPSSYQAGKEASTSGANVPNNMLRAVHFGAGKIGCGLIGHCLHEAKIHITFAKRGGGTVGQNREYTIFQHVPEQDQPRRDVVRGYDVIGYGRQDTQAQVSSAIRRAFLVTCATGCQGYNDIVSCILSAIENDAKNPRPLIVVACENEQNATTQNLARVFGNKINKPTQRKVIFADCLIDRIVPKFDDEGNVHAERYSEWVIERSGIPNEAQQALKKGNVKFVDQLEPWFERKKFTVNTGHAVAAYHGAAWQLACIHQAMRETKIEEAVRGALKETKAYLLHKHQISDFSNDFLDAYAEETILRFRNVFLGDTVMRVGNNPWKKIGEGERLLKPAAYVKEHKLCLPHGPKHLVDAFEKALEFTDETSDFHLNRLLHSEREENTVESITGIEEGHPLWNDLYQAVKRVRPRMVEGPNGRYVSKRLVAVHREPPQLRSTDSITLSNCGSPRKQPHPSKKKGLGRDSAPKPEPKERPGRKAVQRSGTRLSLYEGENGPEEIRLEPPKGPAGGTNQRAASPAGSSSGHHASTQPATRQSGELLSAGTNQRAASLAGSVGGRSGGGSKSSYVSAQPASSQRDEPSSAGTNQRAASLAGGVGGGSGSRANRSRVSPRPATRQSGELSSGGSPQARPTSRKAASQQAQGGASRRKPCMPCCGKSKTLE